MFLKIFASMRLRVKNLLPFKTNNAPDNTANVYRASSKNRQARGGESRNHKPKCRARFSSEPAAGIPQKFFAFGVPLHIHVVQTLRVRQKKRFAFKLRFGFVGQSVVNFAPHFLPGVFP
jgi:hypothetical protein